MTTALLLLTVVNWGSALLCFRIPWVWHQHRKARGLPLTMSGVMTKAVMVVAGIHFLVVPIARLLDNPYMHVVSGAGMVVVLATAYGTITANDERGIPPE